MDFCLQKGFKGQQKEGVTHYFRGILKIFANYISIFAATAAKSRYLNNVNIYNI